MRIRRMTAWVVGVAMGAGAMYLGDPVHGARRRAAARRAAFRQARRGMLEAARRAATQVRLAGEAARTGYRESRGQ